jgi:DNA replicative helicase MCM subunit Mcm2 (Cdc46/Mcm family)
MVKHLLLLHTSNARLDDNKSDISLEFLRKYITYAKMKYFPRLSEEAGHML